MSAFGTFGALGSTPQQPQQQQPGSLFGGGAFGTNPAGGNANPPQNTTNPLFGGTATQNTGATGGGLFGTNPAQPGGLLGTAPAAQQQTGGGLFGTAQGQQQTGGGLFGATNQTGSNTGGTTGGLFGSTAGQGTGTTAGGLFANTTTPANPVGGLFGSTNTTNAPAGGLFGNTNTAGNTGGLFGTNTASTNTGGGLFGASTNTGTGGLFGQAQNQAKPAGSLFGAPAQGSMFGQSQPQQQQNNFFGQSQPQQQQQQQQQPGSLFGSLGQSSAPGAGTLFGSGNLGMSNLGGGSLLGTTTNMYGSRAPATQTSQPDPQSQFIALMQRMDAIRQAWDPNSPQCRFQHFFYNFVDPTQVHYYGRPANAVNDAAWEKAVRENPDPSCLVPVLAVGLDDLQQRVDAQTKQAAEHQEKLKELKTRIEALTQKHQLSNISRLARTGALQTQLTHRVLKVVQHLHLLIPTLRSSSIRPEEEALRAALEDIDDEIRRPGGLGKMRGKLNELWALVDAVRAAKERSRQDGSVEWAVVDDEGLTQITQILAEEQAGLAHVTKILQKDLKDLAVILGTPVKKEEPDVLMGSVSALRGSVIR